MASRLKFNSAIPGDLLEAISYYDEIAVELGDQFRDQVDWLSRGLCDLC